MTETKLPRWLIDALAAAPQAGSGVHKWLFSMARQLWPHRERGEIIALLASAVSGCGRHVPEREITEAVDKAKDCAWQRHDRSGFVPTHPAPRPPEVNIKARDEIIKNGGGLVDLWESSPTRIDSNDPRTEQIIDAMFPGNPLLCCGWSSYSFDTKPRESWRGELANMQLIVPSPMSAQTGLTKEGKISKHTLSNTGQRRFLVVEFDPKKWNDLTTAEQTKFGNELIYGALMKDEHAALLLHLASRAPLVLAVHSGGKSMHGWFYCAGQPEDRLRRFMDYAESLGADPMTWTRSQFVRMPDGKRNNGKRQAVYFFNPRPLEVSR